MAAKLKNLRVTKVDFVDEGANPDAHIRLFKNREGAGQAPEGDDGKGSGVLKKLLAFIGKAAGMGPEEIDSAVEEIQKENSMSFQDKINEANYRKISDEIWDICYALQSSLCSILYDDALDGGGAAEAMEESLKEFCSVAEASIKQWSGKKTADIVNKNEEMTAEDLTMMKAARDRLEKSIAKASSAVMEPENKEELKGDEEEMKIDKSKLTPAERAFLESIEKRCGMEEGNGQGGTEGMPPSAGTADLVMPRQQTAENPVAKAAGQQEGTLASGSAQQAGAQVDAGSAQQQAEPQPSAGGAQPADDIYKGLHPAVRAELEELKKFRESAEDKELHAVAGKYAIIGKKAEELVPVLKNLKAAGGTAYNDYIAVLDESVDIVEKSGAFKEVGRSGHGGGEGGAWAQADAKAVELMKSKTGLSKAQALDEVFQSDPELAARCEKED